MLENFNKLVNKVTEEKKKKEEFENPIYKDICEEPFWRPAGRPRVSSSAARLGGYTKDSIEELKKEDERIENELKELYLIVNHTKKTDDRRDYLCARQQEIRKKMRKLRIKK